MPASRHGDPEAKVAWAERRIAELRDLLAALEVTNGDPVTVDSAKESGYTCYVLARDAPPIPAEIPLLGGEILYNLRAALDHAVYAVISETAPGRKSGFPIFIDPGGKGRHGFDPAGLRMIQHLPADARVVIERAQPFRNHPHPEQHPLWWLHELRNRDEHRTLVLTTAVVMAKSVAYQSEDLDDDISNGIRFFGPKDRAGDEILRLRVAPKVEFEPKFATAVVLREEGPFNGMRLDFAISHIHQKVLAATIALRQCAERSRGGRGVPGAWPRTPPG